MNWRAVSVRNAPRTTLAHQLCISARNAPHPPLRSQSDDTAQDGRTVQGRAGRGDAPPGASAFQSKPTVDTFLGWMEPPRPANACQIHCTKSNHPRNVDATVKDPNSSGTIPALVHAHTTGHTLRLHQPPPLRTTVLAQTFTFKCQYVRNTPERAHTRRAERRDKSPFHY